MKSYLRSTKSGFNLKSNGRKYCDIKKMMTYHLILLCFEQVEILKSVLNHEKSKFTKTEEYS